MPHTFRSTAAPAAVSSGNLTFTEPSGAAQGDLLVVSISYRSTAAFTPNDAGDPTVNPGKWQQIQQVSTGNTTANSTGSIGSGAMFWTIRGSSAPDLQFNRTAGDVAIGRINAYTPGAGETTTLDTSSSNTLGSASTTVTTGTITTTANAALVVLAECMARNTTGSRARATDPEELTWTERGDAGTTTGADASLAVSDAIKFEAGATGTLTYTAGSSARHVAIVGAFKTTFAGPAPNKILRDSSFVTGSGSAYGATNAFVSSAFTPEANELLIVTAFSVRTPGTAATLSITDSASLSWTLITNESDPAWAASLYSWWAKAPSSPSSMTVTITPSGANDNAVHIGVYAVESADTSSPIGVTGTNVQLTDTEAITLSGSPASSSVVVEFAVNWDTSGNTSRAMTPAANSWLLDASAASNADYGFNAQARWNSTTSTIAWVDSMVGATVDTAADLNIALAFEILTATSGIGLSLTKTLDAVTLSSDLDISGYLLTKTLDNVTLSGTFGVLVQVNLSKTLDATTLSSDLDILVVLNLTKTLDAVTLSSALSIGGVEVGLELSQTLGNTALSATLSVIVGLDFNKTLDAATLSAELDILIQLNLSKTLDAVTLSSTLTSGIGLELTKTLADVTLGAALSVLVSLSLNKTLDAVALSSSISISVSLSLSKTLDDTTSSSILNVVVGLALSKTLDATTLSADLSITSGIGLSLSQTLDDVTLASSLSILVQLSLTSTLDATTLQSAWGEEEEVSLLPSGGYIKAAKGPFPDEIEREDLEVLSLVLGVPLDILELE